MTNFKYTYSLVIPHFNSADYLKRMLSSIPERDDIQVIVVDDGSKDEEKEKLALLIHKNLQIIYSPQNYGGGVERNVGFEKVEGKWFIGCDADDFFSEEAFDILDKFVYSDYDYIAYCIKVIDEKTLERLNHPIRSDLSVRNYIQSKNKETITYFKLRNFEPWNKMISVDFIRRNNIHWEKCRINIDVMFGLQIGLKGRNFTAIPDELYNLVFTDNSITRKKKSIEREFGFFLQVMKRNTIYKALGLKYPLYRPEVLYLPYLLKKRGIKDTIEFYKYRTSHKQELEEAKKSYLPLLEGVNVSDVFEVQ